MTKEQAIQVLRSILNASAVKLVLGSQDIAMAEKALEALTPKPDVNPPA